MWPCGSLPDNKKSGGYPLFVTRQSRAGFSIPSPFRRRNLPTLRRLWRGERRSQEAPDPRAALAPRAQAAATRTARGSVGRCCSDPGRPGGAGTRSAGPGLRHRVCWSVRPGRPLGRLWRRREESRVGRSWCRTRPAARRWRSRRHRSDGEGGVCSWNSQVSLRQASAPHSRGALRWSAGEVGQKPRTPDAAGIVA